MPAVEAGFLAERVYRVVEYREGRKPRTVRRGLTLAEAQAWCSREDTHGETRTGKRWFHGYTRED